MVLKSYARVVRDVLTPSFCNPDLSPRRPTAWLDGLRGWAALAVVLSHFCNSYFSSTVFGYGVPLYRADRTPGCNLPHGTKNGIIVDETLINNRHVMQLPFLRLMYYGDPMVAIFFVVSGYSLSLKQLLLSRKGISAHTSLVQSLSSSIIRRPIRLFLPGFISTLTLALAVGFGMTAYVDGIVGEAARKVAKKDKLPDPFWSHFRGWVAEWPPPAQPTMSEQLWAWYDDMYKHMKPFSAETLYPLYDGHLWTIPIEYKCSILLFVTQLALASVPIRKRLVVVTALMTSSLLWGGKWPMACFWAGMLLCELDMNHGSASTTFCKQLAWAGATIFGAYLMSFPAIHGSETAWSRPAWLAVVWLPGDHKRILHAIGAILVTMAISSHERMSGFFSNGLSRYLGRISFSIYLVHGPMWRTVGHYFTLHFLGPNASTVSDYEYHRAVMTSFAITFPIVVYLSDIFARLVDEPVVRLARWVEMYIMSDDQTKEVSYEDKLPLLPMAGADMDDGVPRRDSAVVNEAVGGSRAMSLSFTNKV